MTLIELQAQLLVLQTAVLCNDMNYSALFRNPTFISDIAGLLESLSPRVFAFERDRVRTADSILFYFAAATSLTCKSYTITQIKAGDVLLVAIPCHMQPDVGSFVATRLSSLVLFRC